MIAIVEGWSPRGWVVVGALVLAGAACGDDAPIATTTGATATEATTTGGTAAETTDETTAATTTGTASESATGTGETTTGTTTGTTTEETTEATTAVSSESETAGAICGDGVVDPDEECDGPELFPATCETLGFDGGEVTCGRDCTYDTSGCTVCGDGELDPGEECDDGNNLPGDGCDPECQLEPCDPDGVYTIDGPAVAYTCCVGLVTVNVSGFILSNDGASIASTPSNPVAMTGAATTCPDGSFSNSGEIPGGCTEIYSVSGEFTDANTWSGVYSLEFVGDQCSCFGGMIGTPCVNQVFPVTASR